MKNEKKERKEEDVKYILSYGGGLNSTALLIFLIKNNYPLDLVIFADTGNEFNYTYETVKTYNEYCNNNNIQFQIVKSKNGIIYDYYFEKKITPNRMKRDCTTKFKISPIRQYIRKKYPKEKFVFYIGIDFDEYHRMRESNVKYIKNEYPLVDNKIGRNDCITILKNENLPVPEKSGCYFCPFTNKENWIKLLNSNPELYEQAIKLEENSMKFPKPVSLLSSKPLRIIKEKHQRNDLFKLDQFIPNCDISGSCFL